MVPRAGVWHDGGGLEGRAGGGGQEVRASHQGQGEPAERGQYRSIKNCHHCFHQVVNSIKNWQKDNYHKQLMQLKEKKEMEDQFKKAQKPWSKLLEKVEKCKVGVCS